MKPSPLSRPSQQPRLVVVATGALFLAVLATVGSSSAAEGDAAQGASTPHLAVGARAGVALPVGEVVGNRLDAGRPDPAPAPQCQVPKPMPKFW